MLSNASVVSLIVNSLQDPRCLGTALELNLLMTKPAPDDHHRLVSVDTTDPEDVIETPIESLAELYALLPNSAVVIVPASFGGKTSNSTASVLVRFPDIHLVLNPIIDLDQEFLVKYGNTRKSLQFCLAYLNDNDANLPLKVTQVSFY